MTQIAGNKEHNFIYHFHTIIFVLIYLVSSVLELKYCIHSNHM